MGFLYQLWDQYVDPTDAVAPYTPYSFVPVGHKGPIQMSMGRDFQRRETIAVIPSLDGVLDFYAERSAPMDNRDFPFTFRIFTDGDNDAAADLLWGQVAPGKPQRLVYKTDSGTLWFTTGSNPKVTHTVVAANSWGSGGYIDITVSWRIRPDWRMQYSEATDVWGVSDGVWGVSDGTWGGANVKALTHTIEFFVVDSTGIAGSTLPTIPDTGPSIFIDGPYGGAGTGASAFCSMGAGPTAGQVIQVNMVGLGSGYTNRPTVVFTGGGGSGALAYANVQANVVNGVSVWQVVSVTLVRNGSGYTSAPTVSFVGGGQIVLSNNSNAARYKDSFGNLRNMQVTIPWVPAGYTAILRCAAQQFSLAGASFRPIKDPLQPWWYAIMNGIQNAGAIACLGPGTPLLNGGLLIDWWRKRA